jgi:hypothetical protein
MDELDPAHHVFRHIGASRIHDDFIEPAAFRLRTDDDTGEVIEEGLSVNWVEYFQTATLEEAIAPLREILETKKRRRKVGPQSKFALLNVGDVKAAAAKYVQVTVVLDEEEDDPSHALIKGYEAHNDQVAEELQKIYIAAYPPPPRSS